MFLVQKNGPKISQKIRNPSTPLYLGIIPKKICFSSPFPISSSEWHVTRVSKWCSAYLQYGRFENIVLRLLFSCLSPCPGGCRVGGHQYAERAPTASCRHVVPLNLDIAPAAAAVRAARRTPDKGARPRDRPCAPLPCLLLAGGRACCQPGRWSCATKAPVLPPCRHRPCNRQ